MVKLKLLLWALPLVVAYPAEMGPSPAANLEPRARAPIGKSGRPNTGLPPVGFNEKEQFVDVRPGTEHEYRRPGPNDLRGECPGLNAAANHGFLPRNGIVSPEETIRGLTAAYNMDATQCFIFSIIAIALAGDMVGMKWSIGGPFEPAVPLTPTPPGILGAHNSYEGDASLISGDAYLNGGKVGVFRQSAWQDVVDISNRDGGLNMDNMAEHKIKMSKESIATNPYYFSGPLGGFFVTTGAHNFVVSMMSNHSAEIPGGYMDIPLMSSFFGVSGDTPGQYKFDYDSQQIPQNWYKMPFLNSYTIQQTIGDVLINDALYPGYAQLGGNTGTVNSFVGIDTSNLTGGAYNAQTLLEGNNAMCFAIQVAMAVQPGQANIADFLKQNLGGIMGDLGCKEVDTSKFNMSVLDKYPGYKYKTAGKV